MTRRSLAAAAGLLAFALYLAPIPRRGLVGPDEPRYASIAREMAESGDFVTPVLWGEPWFEKPALLFWLGAAGRLAGLDDYTRVPVALGCIAFLAFLYRTVRREFDRETAVAATCVLATSAGWVAYADAGVFDGPLAALVSASLLCLLPWVRDPDGADKRWISCFGALLGLGVLAKGLVAPAIAAAAILPVAWRDPRRVLALLGFRALAPFAVACLPWYAACYWRNGAVFVEEFILRHHWERFISSSLQHVQPWWFFLPVLLAFLLPWAPLLLGLRLEPLRADPRLQFLAAWALGTVVFFSASVNKLPAYVLPAVPPLAILLAVRWRERPRRGLLAASACSLLLVPLAGELLPAGLADGITRAVRQLEPSASVPAGLTGLALAAAAVAAATRARPALALPAVAALAAVSLAGLKFQTYPAASRLAGAREFFLANAARTGEACLGEARRHVAYGLRHYSRDSIPPCEERPRPLRIEGDPPRIAPSAAGTEPPREPTRVPP